MLPQLAHLAAMARVAHLEHVPTIALALIIAVSSLCSSAARADSVPNQARMEAALREAIAGSCPAHAVQLDPDLTRAAQRYTRAVQSGRAQPDGSQLAFFASLESIDPSPTGGVATIDRPAQADRAVGDLLPRTCRFTHAGVAADLFNGKSAVVAVLTATREVELAPIPSLFQPGEVAHVVGRLLSPALTLPRLYHLTPAGSVEETPLAISNGRFSLSPTLAQPGEHALEVLADGSGGPEVIALRRVFVGIEPPSAPPAPVAPPAAGSEGGDGLGAVEQAIALLRAQRGLPPLTRDPALDAVALGHSNEMARTKTFAHVLKSDGSLSDRLLRANYAHRYAGENIGLSDDALSAHQAIEESPAHLMNLLDPRHSRLGLGAVFGVTPDGEQGIYLTEVLAQPILGSRDPAGEITEQIFAERRRRKLPPVVRDPRLDALALERVRKLVAETGPHIDPDIAHVAIDRIPALRSASAELLIGSSPDDAKLSKDADARDWSVLGVGAVYGSSKEYGPDRLWILLLYAR